VRKQGNSGLFGVQTQSGQGAGACRVASETAAVSGISLRLIITLASQSVTLGPIHCCRRCLVAGSPARYVPLPQALSPAFSGCRCLFADM